MTTRSGFGPGTCRVVSCGSSAATVPAPTIDRVAQRAQPVHVPQVLVAGHVARVAGLGGDEAVETLPHVAERDRARRRWRCRSAGRDRRAPGHHQRHHPPAQAVPSRARAATTRPRALSPGGTRARAPSPLSVKAAASPTAAAAAASRASARTKVHAVTSDRRAPASARQGRAPSLTAIIVASCRLLLAPELDEPLRPRGRPGAIAGDLPPGAATPGHAARALRAVRRGGRFGLRRRCPRGQPHARVRGARVSGRGRGATACRGRDAQDGDGRRSPRAHRPRKPSRVRSAGHGSPSASARPP